MHFWIDKRSQGWGFNGRRPIPPYISGARCSHRLVCGGVHPKLMVTPVHRFQPIESVVANGARLPRSPGYHSRYPIQCHPPNNYSINSSASTVRNAGVSSYSVELLSRGHTATPHHNNAPTAKLKCGFWAFFATVTFFVGGAKYYFHGGTVGVEALAFCSLLVVILLVGVGVSLYEAINNAPSPDSARSAAVLSHVSNDPQESSEDFQNQVPSSPTELPPPAELPPPPYDIAILLPSQEQIPAIIHDSPPPSYEKAVT